LIESTADGIEIDFHVIYHKGGETPPLQALRLCHYEMIEGNVCAGLGKCSCQHANIT